MSSNSPAQLTPLNHETGTPGKTVRLHNDCWIPAKINSLCLSFAVDYKVFTHTATQNSFSLVTFILPSPLPNYRDFSILFSLLQSHNYFTFNTLESRQYSQASLFWSMMNHIYNGDPIDYNRT